MYFLYQVWVIYAEDRKNPVITCTPQCVIAKNEKEAMIKSGVCRSIQKDWDAEYVTIIYQQVGQVNVKECKTKK